MPTSHRFQLNEITDVFIRLKPLSVLDIGVGFGKYGLLAREYLELWGWEENYGKNNHRIDGIEVYEPYILEHHKHIYDEIYIGNAIELLSGFSQKYDLILLIDVLEHFKYEDGKKLLALCESRANYLLISTPKDIGTQGSAYGNEFETHHFEWKSSHLKDVGECFFIPNHQSVIALIGEGSKQIMSGFHRQKLLFSLKRHFPFLSRISRFIKKSMRSR